MLCGRMFESWDRIPILSMKTDLTTEGTENAEGEGTTDQRNTIGLVGPMSNGLSGAAVG